MGTLGGVVVKETSAPTNPKKQGNVKEEANLGRSRFTPAKREMSMTIKKGHNRRRKN